MRTRAYRPEVSGCLEDRSLLSGVAGPLAHPVVISERRLAFIAEHMQNGFVEFERFHAISYIHNEIDDVVVMIPFGRVDGLGVKIDRILDRMRRDLYAHVPDAVHTAFKDVLAATRAEVEARVQAGDVVVR